MVESRKLVLKETGIVAIGIGICLAIMFAVYALLGRMNMTVLLSGLVGGLLAAGNFFFMAVTASMAAD